MLSSAVRLLARGGTSLFVSRRSLLIRPTTLFTVSSDRGGRGGRGGENSLPRRWSHIHYDYSMIESRVLLLLRLFDKIDPQRIQLDSRFVEDLSLDSLDLVEITSACEDEFWMEIPSEDLERFVTPRHIIQYLCDKFDVYEHIKPNAAGKEFLHEQKQAEERTQHH